MPTVSIESTDTELSVKQPRRKLYRRILREMVICRFASDKMEKLSRQNKGGALHVCSKGHEMIGTVCAARLIPGKDWALPYYRDRAFALGFGCTLEEILGTSISRAVPNHSSGRQMPDHFSDKQLRIPCQSSVVGSQFLHAVGIAKAISLRSTDPDEVVYVSAGEGATSQGDFHEALNYACLHNAGVVFVIQDNGWAISVPVEEQTAGGSIAHMARGYAGLHVLSIDGCDIEECNRAMESAVHRARTGLGPSLIVARVPRLGGHSSSDDPNKYKTKKERSDDQSADPLPRYTQWLYEREMLTEEEFRTLEAEAKREVDRAAKRAEQIPFPDPDRVSDHLFGTSTIRSHEKEGERGEVCVPVDAINRALDEEMRGDDRIVVFGQDVAGDKGGVFGATRSLTHKHGGNRCFNTPLAESTIIGTAIGLSLHGDVIPVAEIQFCDYMWTGANQLFNELGSIRYRSAGEWHCPLVIRMPTGGYIQGGPYHSQSVEAFLAHSPGLKVVMPSHAADAKMLLKAAIRDPDPVIFLEHKALYRRHTFCARPEPGKEEITPLGKAQVVTEGDDVTVICYGMMVPESLEAIRRIRGSVEVIDLRTLVPFDRETVLASVKKTGKVLIVHEAPLFCGFGAEIAAWIAEEGFAFLDAPIRRIGGKGVPVPYSKESENRVLPRKEEIVSALENLLVY
ncbi:MAG: thiamine pyrophosphate-dependent enzyme [Simkaniaceae bacterium]|nr:thiamine pyrophosphate-dependent enzyme [Simkaniaceae bacterium]